MSGGYFKEVKERLNSDRTNKLDSFAKGVFEDHRLTNGAIIHAGEDNAHQYLEPSAGEVEDTDKVQEAGEARQATAIQEDQLAAYDDAVNSIRNACKNQAKSADEYYYLVNSLRWRCQSIIDACKLEAVLPLFPQRFVEDEGYRTESFYLNGTEAWGWLDALRNRLSIEALREAASAKDKKMPPEDYLFLGIATSIFFGAQYSSRCVMAIANKLIFDPLPLKSINHRAFIEMDYPVKAGQYNVELESEMDGETTVERRRWFIDPVSLSLFHRYLNARKFLEGGQPLTTPEIFRKVRAVLGIDPGNCIKSMARLIDGAIYLADDELDLGLSETLINVCRDEVPTYAADITSLHGMFGHSEPRQKAGIPALQDMSQYSGESLPKQIEDYPAIKDYYNGLSAMVNEYREKAKSKENRKSFKKKIDALKAKHSSLPGNILVVADWLYYRASKNAFSTTRNDFYELGSIWFPEMMALDFKTMTSADFMVCYENMLSRIENDNTASQKVSHIQSIHKLAVRHYDVPADVELGVLDAYRVGKKSRVRTQIINHRDLKAATVDLLKNKSLTRDQKLVCRIMILAFRTGVRRGELLKIRLRDIEPTGEWWVQIVSNKFGQNKSRSSTRKLPLKTLLHPDEFEDLETFYNARMSELEGQGKSTETSRERALNGLLFGVGTNNMRLAGDYVTALSQMMLRAVTGNQALVFHSLRHSCANVMHAIIEQDYDLAELLSGLPDTQLKEIRREIVGPDNIHLAQYWELASFMGHSSANVTFGSYLHLTDLIVFNKILEAKFPLLLTSMDWLAHDGESQGNTLSRVSNDNKLGLVRYMVRKNKRHYRSAISVPPAKISKAYSFETLKTDLSRDDQIDPATVWHRLMDYQSGKFDPRGKDKGPSMDTPVQDVREAEIQAISQHYGYPADVLASQLQRAWDLMHTPTGGNRQGAALDETLHYRARCEGHGSGVEFERWCAPARPMRKSCQSEAHKYLLKLIENSQKSVKPRQWAEMVFHTSLHDFSHLYLTKPAQVKKITGWFSKIFVPKRWYLELYVQDDSPDSKIVQRWKKAMPKKAGFEVMEKKPSYRGDGAGFLFYQIDDFEAELEAHNKGKTGKKRYRKLSSDQLKYVSQMLLVLLKGD